MSNEKFSTQEQLKTADTQNSTQESPKHPQKKIPAGKVIGRTMKMLWQFYPILLPVALGTAVIQAIMQSVPNIFLERIITIIEQYIGTADWLGAQPVILSNVALLAGIYVIGLICNVISTQGMAIVTQGALQKFRYKMFDHMQNLPIRYFDSHLNGDVMSYYTNASDDWHQPASAAFHIRNTDCRCSHYVLLQHPHGTHHHLRFCCDGRAYSFSGRTLGSKLYETTKDHR